MQKYVHYLVKTRAGNIMLGALLVLSAAIGYGLYYYVDRYVPKEGATTFDEAYDLSLGTYDGTEVDLSDYKHELLVMHTWATWCPYCADELRALSDLKGQYGDQIHIIAVNRAEPMQEAQAFSDALNLPNKIEILVDPDDAFFKKIGGYAMPETVFINRRGEVFFHQRGPMKMDEVTARLDAMIADQ